MSNPASVLEYKCPCCGGSLVFGQEQQQMKCPYCDNTFDLETVREFNDSSAAGDTRDFQWEESKTDGWSDEDQGHMRAFLCPACAGEIITDENLPDKWANLIESRNILLHRVPIK